MQDLPWHVIWSADNPVEVLNKHLLLLVGRFVRTKVIRLRNKDKPWFDDQFCMFLASSRRLIFLGPVIAFGITEESLSIVTANETYSEEKHQFSARNRDVLMNAQSHHKWWSTLKTAVFGLNLSLPSLVDGGG